MPVDSKQLPLKLALDFSDRAVVLVSEIAREFRCTPHHVSDLIAENELTAVNIAPGVSRPAWRVTIESYLAFVARQLTGENRIISLRTLPRRTLIEMRDAINKVLETS